MPRCDAAATTLTLLLNAERRLPSPFAESCEAGRVVQTGIIRAMEPDETLRRRADEIAAELEKLLKRLRRSKK